MNERFQEFVLAMDTALNEISPGKPIKLYHIGRSALVCHYQSLLATKDFDVLENPSAEFTLLVDRFGEGTARARELGIYLEFVNSALPPMPGGFENRATVVDGPWRNLQLFKLDANDLAVSKLARFSPKDREDVRFLADLNLLDSMILERRLESAFVWDHPKDGDRKRESAFENLRIVQSYLNNRIDEF